MARLLLLAGLICVLVAGPARAQTERIVSFDSDITVRADGSLYVEETIDVVAAGRQIKRGIFRDIPTRSIIGPGLNHIAGLTIEKIERDGKPEPYFVRELSAGIRIYIGDADRWVSRGAHRYVIGYTTTRQLHYHDDADELYWNVTGNGWAFPIDRATATIRLPQGIPPKSITGYTGTTGQKGEDYRVLQGDSSTIRLEATKRLLPGEGLTVAVFWPAGGVERPGFAASTTALLADNFGPFLGFALFLAMTVYFYVTWQRVGRDPEKGPIIARFHPPDDMSPVAVGFVWHGGFGVGFRPAGAFAVALTSLAAKGVIKIEEAGRREYVIHEGATPAENLPKGERAVWDSLYGNGMFGVPFGDDYNAGIANARLSLRGAFDREYGRLYLNRNRKQWGVGAALAIAAVLTSMLAGLNDDGNLLATVFMIVFSAGFAVPAVFILYRVFAHLRTAIADGSKTGIIGSLAVAGISFAFLAPVGGVNFFLLNVVPPVSFVIAGASMAVAFAFWFLMSAPTKLGRRTLDEIEGYQLYLSVAEADRLNAAGEEPAITAAIFERHLAYAMALGVEREWTDKFEASLAATAPDSGGSNGSYTPDWYIGHGRRSFRASDLSRSLSGGLTSAASTAATRESSSGGGSGGFSSGGGGFSGGGGGGGGGGGW